MSPQANVSYCLTPTSGSLTVSVSDNATVADNTVETWGPEGDKHDVDVWDTAGQEAFSMLRKMAYPSSNVVVVGFTMTDKNSLQNILVGKDAWCKEITDVIEGFDSWILVGTKCDLWDDWKDDDAHKADCVTMEDCYKVCLPQICIGQVAMLILGQVAEELKVKAFFVTSAKTHVNVKVRPPASCLKGGCAAS